MTAPSPWIAWAVAVGSAAALALVVWGVWPPAGEATRLEPIEPFSQSFPMAIDAGAPEAGEPADALLVLERRAAAAATRLPEGETLGADCRGLLSEATCALLVAHPDWGVEGARRVAEGEVVLGATAAQVEAAWGPPEVKRSEGGRVLWCYDEECATGMVLGADRVVGLKE